MTIDQFRKLNETRQALALWERGVKLASRDEPEFEVTLYQIDGFYVELYYNQKDKMFMRLRCFSNVNLLKPYLDEII